MRQNKGTMIYGGQLCLKSHETILSDVTSGNGCDFETQNQVYKAAMTINAQFLSEKIHENHHLSSP